MTNRVRTMGQIVDTVKTYDEISFNGTHHVSTSTPFHLRSGESTTTFDVVTPGFRRKMNTGAIINNPFHSVTVKRTPHYSGHSARRKSGSGSTIQWYIGDNLYGNGPNPVSSPAIDLAGLKALAGSQAASNVLKPDIEGIVEVAEFKEAISLFNLRRAVLDKHLRNIFRSEAKRLRRATRRRNRINDPSRARSVGAVLANNWLKYRYGIMPLVRLCDQALHLGKEPKPLRMVARGSASDSGSNSGSSSETGSFWKVTFDVNQTLQVDVRAGVLYEIVNSHNRYGFNFSDLPAAAWELVPFSFVVDWFTNVGQFIRGVTPKFGARELATWTSVKRTKTVQVTQTSEWVASNSTYEEVQAPSGGWEAIETVHTRTPGISKKVAFDWRSFKAIPTDKRILDSFALTFQLLLSDYPTVMRRF